MQVSHETIYRSLYIQARGALKKELTQHLRRKRLFRRAKVEKEEKRGKIPNLFLLARDLLRLKTVQYRGTGKVI